VDVGSSFLVVQNHLFLYRGPLQNGDTVEWGKQFDISLISDLTRRRLLVTTLASSIDSEVLEVSRQETGLRGTDIERRIYGQLIERWASLEENITGAHLLSRPEFLALALYYSTAASNNKSGWAGFNAILVAERYHVHSEIRGWIKEAVDYVASQSKDLAAVVAFGRQKTDEILRSLYSGFNL
jgi:hypothetical protein